MAETAERRPGKGAGVPDEGIDTAIVSHRDITGDA